MHEAGFVRNLAEALGGNRSSPVALICAIGGRSAHMQRILATAGFTNVIDVSEGMFGSSAGPGWLKRGLPVKDLGHRLNAYCASKHSKLRIVGCSSTTGLQFVSRKVSDSRKPAPDHTTRQMNANL